MAEREISRVLGPNGKPARTHEFREPTLAERRAMNPKTPHRHERRVRVSCPNGVVVGSVIEFEDGEELRNVLRAVIALEPQPPPGLARVFITRFNNEIGQVVYEEALALVGRGDLPYDRDCPAA